MNLPPDVIVLLGVDERALRLILDRVVSVVAGVGQGFVYLFEIENASPEVDDRSEVVDNVVEMEVGVRQHVMVKAVGDIVGGPSMPSVMSPSE